jgi:hypothetical protein
LDFGLPDTPELVVVVCARVCVCVGGGTLGQAPRRLHRQRSSQHLEYEDDDVLEAFGQRLESRSDADADVEIAAFGDEQVPREQRSHAQRTHGAIHGIVPVYCSPGFRV